MSESSGDTGCPSILEQVHCTDGVAVGHVLSCYGQSPSSSGVTIASLSTSSGGALAIQTISAATSSGGSALVGGGDSRPPSRGSVGDRVTSRSRLSASNCANDANNCHLFRAFRAIRCKESWWTCDFDVALGRRPDAPTGGHTSGIEHTGPDAVRFALSGGASPTRL